VPQVLAGMLYVGQSIASVYVPQVLAGMLHACMCPRRVSDSIATCTLNP